MFMSLPLNHPMTFLKLGSLSMIDARPEAPPLPPIIMLLFILADYQTSTFVVENVVVPIN